MVERYPASGLLDHAALRAKPYAEPPEETLIAEELGLFAVEFAMPRWGLHGELPKVFVVDLA
jgi:hypothetical protein